MLVSKPWHVQINSAEYLIFLTPNVDKSDMKDEIDLVMHEEF